MEKFSKKNEILRSRGFDPGTIRLPVEDLTNRAIERLDSSPLRFPYILDTFDGFFKCSKVNFNPPIFLIYIRFEAASHRWWPDLHWLDLKKKKLPRVGSHDLIKAQD